MPIFMKSKIKAEPDIKKHCLYLKKYNIGRTGHLKYTAYITRNRIVAEQKLLEGYIRKCTSNPGPQETTYLHEDSIPKLDEHLEKT